MKGRATYRRGVISQRRHLYWIQLIIESTSQSFVNCCNKRKLYGNLKVSAIEITEDADKNTKKSQTPVGLHQIP
uniref:Uncharacterized protein n=1 Tax=Strigamia maritima TaxID=126957 RepID=T1IWQ2_STRMM